MRIYRTGFMQAGSPPSATNALGKFVGEAGVFYDGTNYRFFFYDSLLNGPADGVSATGTPGTTFPSVLRPTTDIFVVTLNKGPYWNVRFLQFLPMMQRALPPAPLAEQFAYLFFGTPIVRVPRWCAVIKNVAWDYAR